MLLLYVKIDLVSVLSNFSLRRFNHFVLVSNKLNWIPIKLKELFINKKPQKPYNLFYLILIFMWFSFEYVEETSVIFKH